MSSSAKSAPPHNGFGEPLNLSPRLSAFLAAFLPVCVLYRFWEYKNFVPFDWGYDDVETYFLPMQQMLHRMFQSGQVHFWNPHIFGGVSLAGNPQAAMFYPLSLISYLLTPEISFPLLFLLHVALSGLFCYLMLRLRQKHRSDVEQATDSTAALIGSLCYSLSGCILLGVGQVNQVAIGAWLPAAVAALECYARTQQRIYLVLQGVAIGLIWTAGFPQIALYSQLCMILYTLIRRPPHLIMALFFPTLLGFVLSGVQNLPFLETAAQTSRAALNLNDWCFADGLSLGVAAQYFVPWMVDSSQANDHFTYFGTIGLFFAGFSLTSKRKDVWLFFGLALFFFVLSLGMAGPLDFVLSHLPVFKQFKAPWRLNWVTTFFLSVCAGEGLFAFLRWRPQYRAGLGVLCLLELGFHQSTHLFPRPIQQDELRVPTALRTIFNPAKASQTYDSDAMRWPRYATVEATHSRYGNQGQVWGWSNVIGVDATPTADWCELILAASLGRIPEKTEIADLVYRSNAVSISNFKHPVIRMLNVEYVVLSSQGQLQLGKLAAPVPRAWNPTQAKRVEHRHQLAQLIQPTFDPLTVVLVEEEVGPLSAGQTSIVKYECDQIELQCSQPDGPGLVVVSDSWFPGWEARLDSQPVPILRANYALRAIQIPTGKHTVQMLYRPRSLYYGAILTGCGLVYLLVELILFLRERRSEC